MSARVNTSQGVVPIPQGGSTKLVQVTASDSQLANPLRGLYVGVAGNVTVKDMEGTTVVFTSVPAGSTLLGMFDFVMATGTTASAFVGYI